MNTQYVVRYELPHKGNAKGSEVVRASDANQALEKFRSLPMACTEKLILVKGIFEFDFA